MARAGVDFDKVVLAAANIADANGMNAVTIKAVADTLGIRNQSVYKHVNGIEGIRSALSLYGIIKLRDSLAESAIGLSGSAAVESMCAAYLLFSKKHPGIYEAIQWKNPSGDAETAEALDTMQELIYKVIGLAGVADAQATHVFQIFRCLMHGFASLENEDNDGFHTAIRIVMLGIKDELGVEFR